MKSNDSSVVSEANSDDPFVAHCYNEERIKALRIRKTNDRGLVAIVEIDDLNETPNFTVYRVEPKESPNAALAKGSITYQSDRDVDAKDLDFKIVISEIKGVNELQKADLSLKISNPASTLTTSVGCKL